MLFVVLLTAFAIDTIQYNAAVDYLNFFGIPIEDLSNYSHKEVKEAAKTIDAGESSPLTEEILNLLPDNKESRNTDTGNIRADKTINANYDKGRGFFTFG